MWKTQTLLLKGFPSLSPCFPQGFPTPCGFFSVLSTGCHDRFTSCQICPAIGVNRTFVLCNLTIFFVLWSIECLPSSVFLVIRHRSFTLASYLIHDCFVRSIPLWLPDEKIRPDASSAWESDDRADSFLSTRPVDKVAFLLINTRIRCYELFQECGDGKSDAEASTTHFNQIAC